MLGLDAEALMATRQMNMNMKNETVCKLDSWAGDANTTSSQDLPIPTLAGIATEDGRTNGNGRRNRSCVVGPLSARDCGEREARAKKSQFGSGMILLRDLV